MFTYWLTFLFSILPFCRKVPDTYRPIAFSTYKANSWTLNRSIQYFRRQSTHMLRSGITPLFMGHVDNEQGPPNLTIAANTRNSSNMSTRCLFVSQDVPPSDGRVKGSQEASTWNWAVRSRIYAICSKRSNLGRIYLFVICSTRARPFTFLWACI